MAGPWEQYQSTDSAPWTLFAPEQKKPEEQGIFEAGLGALKRGFEQFGEIGAGYSLAGSQIVGDKEAAARKMAEAKAEIQRQQQEVGGLTVADIERIYKDKGLVNAAGEVPQFLVEQVLQAAPTMATPLAVGLGVTALAAPTGLLAPVIGTVAGIGTYGLQQFGSLMRRQAVEKERPEELSVGMAATGAALQAPIGYFADRFTAGLGGLGQKGVLEVGKELAARKAAGEIGALGVAGGVGAQAAKGSALGFIAEAPTEALEQAIERWQAGLPLANDDAYNEYKEAFFGAGAVGVGIGGVSRGRTAYKGYKAGPEKEIPETDLKPKEEGPLLLPAPAEIVANERNFDPLTNPLGNFFEGEITKDVVNYINKDRVENNKPKLKSFSLEDIVDAMSYQNLPDDTKQGYIDTLLAYKTGYKVETDDRGNPIVFTPQDIANAAGERNISAGEITTDPVTGGLTFGTEGMRDFLTRTTGTDNLSVMSQPQLYSAFKALKDMPSFAESTVLEPETNAVRFTEKQYTNALNGLGQIYDEIKTDSLGRTSVIDEIQQLTGLTRRGDAVALYNQAIQRGDLETELTVQNVMGKPTNVVNVKFGGLQADLPQQFDIRKQAFKQRTEPEFYEIRNGNITINADKPIRTAQEAEAYLKKQQAIHERLANEAESKGKDSIQALQRRIQAREDQLDIQRAQGRGNTQVFQKLAAHISARNKADEAKVNELQEQVAFYRRPLKVVGVGEKPIVEDRYVYYEGDKPVAAFGTRAQAQEFGVTRMDDAGLESLLTIAPEAKGVSPKRLKGFAEQEIRKRQDKLPKGIEITTTGKYKQEVVDKVRQLEKDLAPAMKRLGLDNVKLKIVDSIANGTSDGAYVNSLIKIAYGAQDPMGTLRHEGIHALKELGAFTDAEWKALSNKAKSEWVNKYIKGPGLYKFYQDAYIKSYKSLKGFDEFIQEEAIAEAFRDFANTQPPAGLIGQIFNRIKLFFEALRNTFTRAGFQTADSIFERIEKGEVRTKAPPVKPSAERYQLALPKQKVDKFFANAEKISMPEGVEIVRDNWIGGVAGIGDRDGAYDLPYIIGGKQYTKDVQDLVRRDLGESFKGYRLMSKEEFEEIQTGAMGTQLASFTLDPMTGLRFSSLPMYARRPKGDLVVVEMDLTPEHIQMIGHLPEKEIVVDYGQGYNPEAVIAYASPISPAPLSAAEKLQIRPPEPEVPRKIGKKIVGAPPGAGTEQARTALVKRMTNLLQHPYSMIDESKDWYERSGQTIRDFARGNKDLMEKTVRLMALYSQANSLGGNTTATIKSLAQLASGQDTAFAGRFPNKTAERIPAILAAKEFDTNLPGIDDKIMNFYQNLHDAAFNSNFFDNASTIDRWMMRLFGYPHSEDREQGGATGVSATQYKYAKDLLKRIAQKHFEATGERLKPRQIQAVLWTYVKNTTEADKAKKNGKEFTPTSMDFADYVKRATANITWEARPSTSLPIIPGIHTAPREQQEAFNRAVREIFEEPDGESKVFKLLKSAVLYKSNASSGAYENKIVPNTVTQVILQKDNDNQYITDIANKAAAIYGYVTKQDAVPWYRADPTAKSKFASIGYKVTAEGVEPDAAFEDKLFKHLNEAMPGVGFTRVDNSFDFVNFRGADGKPFFMPDKKYIEELQKALKSFSPDINFDIDQFRAESGYISNNWKENTDGQGYFKEFSPRELADIRATLDDWRKAYDSLVEQYGREYGWDRPTEPAVRPSAEGRGIILGTRQPGASSFTGRHFGKEKVDTLSGSMYGTGIKGAEAKRLADSFDPRIKKRVYFYVPNEQGKFPTKEAGLGINVYTQKFDNILAPGDLMSRLYREANRDMNDFESMVIDQGFDGYAVPDMGMMVILNNDVPVSFEGKEPDLKVEGKLQIRAPIKGSVDPKIWGRVEATTTARQQKGFIERILTSIFPDSAADFRFKYINFLEGIERQTKKKAEAFGNKELLAENSAIAAALQSLRAAGVAASSFRDGVPVFDKGYTYVSDLDGKVKGLIPILMPLAKYGDPDVYRLFQYYAAARRGQRLTAEGREKVFNTPEDKQAIKDLDVQYPEFKLVFDDYQKYNQGLVNFMRDTGVISEAEAKIWTQNWDYIPFYRQLEGEKTAGPKVFSALSGVSKPKELKGGVSELDDFMETIVRNARAAIEAGMKNEAARRSVRDAVALGTAQELKEAETGPDIINVKIDGKTKYYRVADPLLVKSMQSLNMPQLELISFLSKPAEILRNFVTKDPGFILANLGRDSLQAWITSGTKMTPVVDTFKEFGTQLFKQSPVAAALARAGMTGYDFAGDVKSTSEEVAKALRKATGTRTGVEKGLMPITGLWDALEQGSHASDMATRIAVYKRTLERTGSEAEAMYQAMEVLNFSRRGASPTVRMLAAMIPFLNARIQGLDVLYRSGWGEMATENKDTMKKAFAVRALTMMGMSMLYWFLVSDTEEYERLTKEERDNYWIVPGLEINDKPFRFPIPFELGVIFKVIPERVLETAFGSDTGKDLKESMIRQLTGTLAVSPPQAFLPILENITNYSLFTGEPLVSRGLEDLEPRYQFTSGTSMMARDLGAALNISPIKIENIVRGYTGTLGTYAVTTLDAIYRGQDDPVKANMRLEQYPVIKRFFATDSGTVSAYYDLKEQVDTAVRTVNMLERTGDAEGLRSYLEGTGKVYLMKDYVNAVEKDMKQIREARKIVNESKTLTAEEKREYIDRLHEMEVAITDKIRMIKKSVLAR